MTSRVQVHRFGGPDEVDRERWDAAAGGGLYLSHRWLSAMQDRRGRVAAYLLAERAGEPVAAAVLHRVDRPGFVLQEPVGLVLDPELRAADTDELPPTDGDRLDELLGRLRTGLDACYPAAVCVTPVGLTAGVHSGKDTEVAVRLAQALDDIAAGWRAATRAALYLDGSGGGPALGSALSARGYRPATVAARASLPVRWPDPAGYLAGFPSLKRKVIRKEWAASDAAGLHAEVLPASELGPVVDQLAALAARVQHRHGNGYDEDGARATLEFLLGRCPDLAAAILVRSGERVVAFHLVYRYGHGLYSALTGQDYSDLARRGFAHFRALYYEPARLAAAEGRTHVDYGLNPRLDQLARGGEAVPLTSWFAFDALPGSDVGELLDLISTAARLRMDRLARGG